jgi:asparagine N-glycosylation enzyme membrane subunit Stt3
MDNDGRGWLVFAAVVLGVAGIMRIFDGIWAFRYKGAIPDNLQNSLLGTNLKNYGWLWLIVGILLILCALGVMARSQISRWIGVFAGAVIAVSAIWWMPYYPIWSLVYIGIGILVIYALVMEGGRESVTP